MATLLKIPQKNTTNKLFVLSALLFATFVFTLPSCSNSKSTSSEIIIGLKPEAIPMLIDSNDVDQTKTNIPSLDALNRKWKVQQMIALYPDVSSDDEIAAQYGLAGVYKLVVPTNTDLKAMIREYEANPLIDYAELNKPAQINQ